MLAHIPFFLFKLLFWFKPKSPDVVREFDGQMHNWKDISSCSYQIEKHSF